MWVNIDGVNAKSITADGNPVGLITVDGKIAFIGWKAGQAIGVGSQTIYDNYLEINVPNAPSEDKAFRTFEGILPYDFTIFSTMYFDWEVVIPDQQLTNVMIGLALPNTAQEAYLAYYEHAPSNMNYAFPRRVNSLNISGLTHTALVPKFSGGDMGKYGYGVIIRVYNIWFE